MAKKLSAYNMHVASYIRSHPNMPRQDAFRMAAKTWKSQSTRTNPDLGLPSINVNNDQVKWIALGVLAWYLLPKVLPLIQSQQQPPAQVLPPFNPYRMGV